MTPHELYVIEISKGRVDRQLMLDALGIVSAYGPGRQIRHNSYMTMRDEDEATRLRMEGMSYEAIGHALGFGTETVRTNLRRRGL